jgi:hypothetical protein
VVITTQNPVTRLVARPIAKHPISHNASILIVGQKKGVINYCFTNGIYKKHFENNHQQLWKKLIE